MLSDHLRIVVVGTSGSGKTTFARSLSKRLDVEHLELDEFYWGPDWARRSDFPEAVGSAVSSQAWVADGNYGAIRDVVWGRATAIVWLNYSFSVVFGRAVSRSVRRLISREVIFSGNRESLRTFFSFDGIPMWVLRTYGSRRRGFRKLFRQERYRHLEVFEARSPAEGDALLASVRLAGDR